MRWKLHAASHWVCSDFAIENSDGVIVDGYEIHARCCTRKNSKNILSYIIESWIVRKLSKDKIVKRFNRQDHILDAMNKGVAYVEGCLRLQELAKKKVDFPKATITKDIKRFEKGAREFKNPHRGSSFKSFLKEEGIEPDVVQKE